MSLLERVASLVQADVPALLLKADDPERFAAQLVLDMENQLVQLKTEVAIAIGERHRLLKVKKDEHAAHAAWLQRVDTALALGEDDLSGLSLERALAMQKRAEASDRQYVDKSAEVDLLRRAYAELQAKLRETKPRVEFVLGHFQRNRSIARAMAAVAELRKSVVQATGMRGVVAKAAAEVVVPETAVGRIKSIDEQNRLDALLVELKDTRRD